MAKGKLKPSSKPKAKKAEPTPKKVAEKKEVKVKVKVEKKVKKKVEPVMVSQNRASVASRYSFPSAKDCQHTTTKRTIDRRMRAMHVCTNPNCKKVVRHGAR